MTVRGSPYPKCHQCGEEITGERVGIFKTGPSWDAAQLNDDDTEIVLGASTHLYMTEVYHPSCDEDDAL